MALFNEPGLVRWEECRTNGFSKTDDRGGFISVFCEPSGVGCEEAKAAAWIV
jgi:hypothetical protein